METSTTGDSLAYFYCNYKEEQRRDPSFILRSLIKQLCLRSPESNLPEPVLKSYDLRKRAADFAHLLNVKECELLLIELSSGFPRTTIVLDALDECDPKSRGSLFDVLDAVVGGATANPVKVFVTSRDDADLRKRFAARPEVYIQERDNSVDIGKFIRTEVQKCIKNRDLLEGDVNDKLKERVVATLEAGARGMYVLFINIIFPYQTTDVQCYQVHLGEISNSENMQRDHPRRRRASVDQAAQRPRQDVHGDSPSYPRSP